METQLKQPYFEEKQSFAAWIKLIVLLPAIVIGVAATLTWIAKPGPIAVTLTLVVLFFLFFAVPHFLIRLVTTLDSMHLHLRIDPLGLPIPFLPPRMRDVELSDISRWEVHTYSALKDREYWGRHLWGLGSGSSGSRYLYIMKAGPFAGRGVQVDIGNRERLLIGSEHPEELAAAIDLAKSQSRLSA